jgi:glycerol-3-phosphate acyltransferase PlsY
VFGEYLDIQKLLGAMLAGYLLGSIPFAYLAARYRGLDIFNTGSRTAGTANVFWNIGRRTGTLVFVGDVAKGSAAVLFAGLLDVSWSVALLAGGAAVLGHWKSVFSGFRGGDGMATLIGVTIALEPGMAAMGILIGTGVLLLLRRSPLRSTWGISACFIVMLGVSQYYQVDRDLVMGLVALAMLVLFRSMIGRRGRIRIPAQETDEVDLALELEFELELELDLNLNLEPDPDPDPDTELGPAAQENP